MLNIQIIGPGIVNHVSTDLQTFAREHIKRPGAFREPLIKCAKEVLTPAFVYNIDVGGRPKRWPPLKASYVAKRLRKREHRAGRTAKGKMLSAPRPGASAFRMEAFAAMARSLPILKDTRKLYNAVGAFARWHIANNEAWWGNLPPRAWYGIVHQVPEIAAKAGRGHTGIPPRQYIYASPQDVDACVKIFEYWLMDKFEEHVKRVYAGVYL
jgi:hypothetical protein